MGTGDQHQEVCGPLCIWCPYDLKRIDAYIYIGSQEWSTIRDRLASHSTCCKFSTISNLHQALSIASKDVQLDGNLAVHVIPTASLGINVRWVYNVVVVFVAHNLCFQILSGLINAQANLVLDCSVCVDLSASLSGVHVSVGDVVRLDASVTGKDTCHRVVHNESELLLGTGFNYPGYNFFNLQVCLMLLTVDIY